MSDECALLRGEPAESLGVILSEDGVGKMLLSERRAGAVAALEEFHSVAVSESPEADIRICDDVPEDVDDGAVLFVRNHHRIRDFDEKVARLPRTVKVIVSRELCHQVCAVFRFR